jgi:AcrR family transcriptional regulator
MTKSKLIHEDVVPAQQDDNEQRILKVAERLFARRGYSNTTIREIAEQAHVTHPLIYHYWGSKRGLLSAVLERNQSRMRAVIDKDADPHETILELVRENLAGSRTYLLILVRAWADGMPAREWPGGYPAIEGLLCQLLTGSEGHDTEVRETLACAVALLTGWVLLEKQLLEVVELPLSARGSARDALIRSIERVFEPVS